MKVKNTGHGLFLSLMINLVLNLTWLLPAAILLVLHFWIKLSYWWAVGAVGIWLFGILFWTLFLSFSARAGSERDKPKENKNPYSAKAIFGKAIDPFCPKNAQTVRGGGADKKSEE